MQESLHFSPTSYGLAKGSLRNIFIFIYLPYLLFLNLSSMNVRFNFHLHGVSHYRWCYHCQFIILHEIAHEHSEFIRLNLQDIGAICCVCHRLSDTENNLVKNDTSMYYAMILQIVLFVLSKDYKGFYLVYHTA